MARELPGFYYDEDKGKYFRIQQSHRAVPGSGSNNNTTNNNYTKQSINALKREKFEREADARRETRRRRQTVDRSRTRAQTGSLPLSARLGGSSTTPARDNRARVVAEYAGSLVRCHVGDRNRDGDRDGGGNVRVATDGFVGGTFSISRSGTLRTAYYSPRQGGNWNLLSIPSGYGSGFKVSDHNSQGSAFNIGSARMDLCLTDGQASDLVTTLYSHDQECAVLTSSGLSLYHVRPIAPLGELSLYELSTDLYTTNKVNRIWDLAGAPNTPSFALATNTGLCLGQYSPGSIVPGTSPSMLARGEKLNVAFKDANLVMSGERSGRIVFSDIRAPARDSVIRLLHSSAVLGTIGLPDSSPHHVLAHGFSTTSVYDLRYVAQTPVARKARSTQTSNWSTPYTRFAVPKRRCSDRYVRGRKVAYSADLGIVVAANTAISAVPIGGISGLTSGFVTLYSVHSGKVIDSPLTRHEYVQGVRSVDIRRVSDGPESVFCLAADRLDEWTIQGRVKFGAESEFDNDAVGRISSQMDAGVRETDRRRREGGMTRQQLHDLSIEQEWDRGNQMIERIPH